MLKTLLLRCILPKTISQTTLTCCFATSQQTFSKNIKYQRKWVTTDKWNKVKTSSGSIPWQPNVPCEKTEDPFSEEESHKGMYDYLAILGDDVTLQPKLFCKGSAHIRGHNASELQRLLRKRRMLGYRMHIEDLDACNKRIRYLTKLKRVKEGF